MPARERAGAPVGRMPGGGEPYGRPPYGGGGGDAGGGNGNGNSPFLSSLSGPQGGLLMMPGIPGSGGAGGSAGGDGGYSQAMHMQVRGARRVGTLHTCGACLAGTRELWVVGVSSDTLLNAG